MNRPGTPSQRPELEPLGELVARTDMAALVDRYAPGDNGRAGTLRRWNCPNPAHHDTHPSFTVTRHADGVDRGKCWSGCSWAGDALDLVGWLEGLDRPAAATRLRALNGEHEPDQLTSRVTPINRTPPAPKPIAPLPETKTPPPEAAGRLMADYLKGRGWPTETAELFGLEVVLGSNSEPRIRHPFYVNGPAGLEVSTWQDRATGPGPKWLAPTGRPLTLYNGHRLTGPEVSAVVICEGPADTITAALALKGRPEVVAVGVPGVEAWKPEYAALFTGLEVVIAADNDGPGERLVEKLWAGLGPVAQRVLLVRLEGHKDLTDSAKALGLEALGELLTAGLTAKAPPPTPPDRPPRYDEAELDRATLSALQCFDDTAELNLWPAATAARAYTDEDLFGPPPAPSPRPAKCSVCNKNNADDRGLCSSCNKIGRWTFCSACSAPALKAVGSRCSLTPGCAGAHETRPEVAA